MQFGVVVNWTVSEVLAGTEPPGIRMNPSVTVELYPPLPPPLAVVVTPVGLLKQVGTATSRYLIPLAADAVKRTRTVAV